MVSDSNVHKFIKLRVIPHFLIKSHVTMTNINWNIKPCRLSTNFYTKTKDRKNLKKHDRGILCQSKDETGVIVPNGGASFCPKKIKVTEAITIYNIPSRELPFSHYYCC